MDVANFDVDSLPLSRLLHRLLLLPLHDLLFHPQLEVVVNGLPLILDLYPWLPLPFHHLPLVPDKSIQETTLKQTWPTVFVASRQFQRNGGGEQPLFP